MADITLKDRNGQEQTYQGIDTVRIGENDFTLGAAANLQEKSVSITENGMTSVLPDAGYDGISQLNVVTNVSGGASDTPFQRVTVTVNRGGAPLEGATVTASLAGQDDVVALTNASGQAVLDLHAAGKWTLTSEKDGGISTNSVTVTTDWSRSFTMLQAEVKILVDSDEIIHITKDGAEYTTILPQGDIVNLTLYASGTYVFEQGEKTFSKSITISGTTTINFKSEALYTIVTHSSTYNGYMSSDGRGWMPLARSIAIYHATMYYFTNGMYLFTSKDLNAWKQQRVRTTTLTMRVTYDSSSRKYTIFVPESNNTITIYQTTDLSDMETFEEVSTLGTSNIYDFRCENSIYYYSTGSGLYASSDLINWKQCGSATQIPFYASNTNTWYTWYVYGSTSYYYTSTDGFNFVQGAEFAYLPTVSPKGMVAYKGNIVIGSYDGSSQNRKYTVLGKTFDLKYNSSPAFTQTILFVQNNKLFLSINGYAFDDGLSRLYMWNDDTSDWDEVLSVSIGSTSSSANYLDGTNYYE